MRRQSIRAVRIQEEQTVSGEPEPSQTGLEQSEKTKETEQTTAEPQNGITVKPQTPDLEEEKATEKLTLYLHPSQRDKLDELIMGYKRKTGKRITHNKLMRILIDRAELTGLL